MISRLVNWFTIQFDAVVEGESLSPTLACAVLFYEVVRADHRIEPEELDTMRNLLSEQVAADELEDLLGSAREQADEALDLVRFTRVINEHFDQQQKRDLLISLWRLAFADSHLDGHEDYAIRKIADLLYLNHSDFIQCKLEASKIAE